ncbi:MAG TPA: DnaJ domain-containing protein [Ktedonobacteraceae bacterium]|nr:DnaJ domain-containing protein [Ktedonobacteraceae bacterium]
MIPNYYAQLGVEPDASSAQIKTAYRHLARQHHPDLNGRSEDEQIKALNEAYAVLGDTKKRAAYDELRRRERQRVEAVQSAQQPEEPKMTWMEGMIGFVRELKKEMRDD